MNSREIEQLEKKSIYSIHINDDLKDSVINNHLKELNAVIKQETKKKDLIVLVIRI
jgi:hypothetical protein